MRITGGEVFTGHVFEKRDLIFEKKILNPGKSWSGESYDASGCYVVPGFVDIHTHGALGEDFSDGKDGGLEIMSRHYARNGVTSYLATTMTLQEDVLTQAVSVIHAHRRQGGAKCAGIHLEGPFLCAAKKGAQAECDLHRPDPDMWHRLNEASGRTVKIVTVACEEPGGIDFVREVSKYCTVSLGHSVADYDTAMKAFEAGASHVTHLFNAMPPLHHRDPGIIGAAMDSGVSAELICDGLHIHPSVVRAAYAMFGERMNLISDSLRCSGMPDGEYVFGGQLIELHSGKATMKGSDTLAGSVITVYDAVRNAVRFGIPLESAVYSASTAPAKAAGLDDIGSLEAGKCADILVLDKNLELKALWIDGERIYL